MRILAMGNVELLPHLGSGKTRLGWREGFAGHGHSYEPVTPPAFEMAFGKTIRARKYRQAIGALLWFWKNPGWREYDIIEFHGDEFWLATLWLSRQRRRPLIIASTDGLELLAYDRHAFDDMNRGRLGPLKKLGNRLTHESWGKIAFRRADRFASICKLDADYMQKQGYFTPAHCVVAAPGLDVEYSSCDPAILKEHAIAFNGSWIERKGISTLIKVADTLLREDERLEFHVFGTGGKEALVRASFDPSLHARIHVYGRLSNSDLAHGLARCKVFIFPSEYEGFGIALGEAMACSCACVTTPTGYGWELKDGEEAFIRPFGDHNGMTVAARQLLTNPTLLQAISSSGRDRARQLRWDTSAEALIHAYEQWLEEYQSRQNGFSRK